MTEEKIKSLPSVEAILEEIAENIESLPKTKEELRAEVVGPIAQSIIEILHTVRSADRSDTLFPFIMGILMGSDPIVQSADTYAAKDFLEVFNALSDAQKSALRATLQSMASQDFDEALSKPE